MLLQITTGNCIVILSMIYVVRWVDENILNTKSRADTVRTYLTE